MTPVRTAPRVPALRNAQIVSQTVSQILGRTISGIASLALVLFGLSQAGAAQLSCTGLCLQQVACSPGVTTSITGTVYAPNGTDPLPNVLVYIPNAAVQPFTPGISCSPNGIPASGSPLVSTTTAVDGTFKLTNVPVGTNIPLVIQAGKWRRQFTIPVTNSCSDTAASTAVPATAGTDTTTVPAGHVLHLPQNQAEGDIPLIAISTGDLDGVECVLSKMGVSQSEFTNPSGGGRIQFYYGERVAGAKIDSSTPSETVLEGSTSVLNQYDLVLLACQGQQYTPAAQSLANMHSYANAGGRIYATHYSYDFLYNNSDFSTVADWRVNQSPDPADQTATINQNFTDGAEFAQWLKVLNPTSTLGSISVNTIRKDQDGINSATSQEYLSIANPSEVIQFTFSTPVAVPPASQCGRVLFNEYHVENSTGNEGKIFPAECPTGAITPQEQFLEYSLFDLGTFTSPSGNPTVSLSFTNTPTTLTQGDTADTAAITVTNTSTTTATNATLQVAVTMPAGLTATAIAPAIPTTSGWTCTLGNLTCTRTTGLNASSSDAIVVTFSVAPNATSPQTISATVSQGNLAAPVTATDPILVPLTLSPPSEPLPNASFNVPYSQQFTAGGGDPGYTYSLSGTLPPGLSLNSATGLLSGTPTVAADGNTYTFNVIVTDSASNTVSQSYSIAVPQVFSGLSSTLSAAGSAVAGSTVPVTATVLDTAGNPVAGANVTFAETPSGGTTSTGQIFNPGVAITNSSGVAVTQLVYTAADTLTLSATVSGPVTGNIPQTPTITLVAPAYIVTVNTDEASGNGVPSNCVDPNLPTYTTAANANCSLRDAVTAANALTGVTTDISFASSVGSTASPGTITIASGTSIGINQNVVIMGPGASALTISGANLYRILNVSGGVTATITGLTFANGNSNGDPGGAVLTYGTLTASKDVFSGNVANGSFGGAIGVEGNGTALISYSTFIGNSAGGGSGGAVGADAGGTAQISYSTFNGNIGNGAAVCACFGSSIQLNYDTITGNTGGSALEVAFSSTVQMLHTTVSGNSAGLELFGSSTGSLQDSILSNNQGQDSESDTSYTDLGGNIYGAPAAAINLSPLGVYGGTTGLQTLLPLPGSAAICAGVPETLLSPAPTTDERGLPISSTYGGSTCYDSGAVQTQYGFSATFNLPSQVLVGSPVTPAPIATVTENGTPLTAGPATVNISDADSDLSGSATVSVPTSASTGQAPFSNLLFTGPEQTDTLTATLPLNSNVSPAISLSATSNTFQVGQVPQTITNFNPPSTATYGQAPITLSATGGASGNPVTFKVINGGPGLISGNQLTITGAGTIKVEADQAGNTVYSAANPVTAYIVVSPAVLTVTIVGNPTKAYDGTTTATLTSSNYQVNGVVSPDVITVTQPTGTYAAATAGTQTVTAALTASSFSAAPGSLNNYTLPASAAGPGTINQASSLTKVTCIPSVVYNGQAQTPCFASVSGAGGLSQPVTPVTYSSNVNAGVNTASASATYAGDVNHTGSTGSATFTIQPAPLVAAAGSYSGQYDGATHAVVPGCSVSTNYDGITCTNSISSVGPDVGSGVVTPVIHGLTANYNAYSNNGSWSITARPVVLTAGTLNGTYNGSVQSPSPCTSNYAGVTCTNNPASVGPGAGSGTITPVPNIGTGIPADYVIAATNGSYSIAQATSITNISCPASVVYNGSAQTPCTATATGAGNFSTSVTVTYTLNTNVGTATASATFTGDANHTGSTNSTTFSITPAPVTAQAGVGNAVYDGNTHSPSACTVTGAYTGNLTCTNSPATVGPGVVNTTIVPVVAGSNLGNFAVTPINGSFTINQAASATTVSCPASVTYTGAAQTPCTATVTGVGGLSQSVSVTYTSNLHAGTATAAASYSGDTNHSASTGSTTFTINKATPVISWPTPASFTYGTPISATQLNATASYLGSPVAGTFVYTAETGPNPLGVLLPPGTTALSATINPTDSTDFNSATAYVVFTVSKAQTTTTLAVTTTQTVTGTTATITATVHPQIGGTPTGTITYYSGSTVLGSAAVGTPFTTGVLPVGTDQLTAVYSGDSNFVGSTSSATAVTSIAPTTVTLIPALTHVFYPASAVSFTVIVPLKNLQLISGTVTLYDGSTVIGTYSLPAGGILVGITPQLSVGTHNLRAVYGGNAQYPPGESPIETVTVSAL